MLVGLAAPPLLASVAVGAAAGGLVGKFMHHKVESGMESGLGEKLKPGTAAIIAMVDDEDRLAAEQALAGTPAKSVVTMDKKGVRGLKDALAEAALKFVPDRTVLPIPDPAFGGAIGRSLRTSAADWTINMTPTPPEGAPNVLLVLIDDAGFGNPSTFGGPIDTPTMTRVAEAGLTYDHFHVTALCSPTRAALLTGRNHHTVGFGSVGEFPGPFPGYTSARPKDCAPFVRMLQGNGYSTGGLRQVAPDPRPRAGHGRPLRPLAERLGLRPLLGLPHAASRASTTRSSPRTTRSSACPRARTAPSTTCPTT